MLKPLFLIVCYLSKFVYLIKDVIGEIFIVEKVGIWGFLLCFVNYGDLVGVIIWLFNIRRLFILSGGVSGGWCIFGIMLRREIVLVILIILVRFIFGVGGARIVLLIIGAACGAFLTRFISEIFRWGFYGRIIAGFLVSFGAVAVIFIRLFGFWKIIIGDFGYGCLRILIVFFLYLVIRTTLSAFINPWFFSTYLP